MSGPPRILVTGATGFLGGRLVRRLRVDGAEVIAAGRDGARGAQLAAKGIRFLQADLAGLSQACRAGGIAAVDAVVHAAALSSAWGSRAAFREANVDGTRHALDLARSLGARRFLFVSSPSLTFRFRDQHGIREADALPPPVNAYAWSKGVAEALVRAERGMGTIILRPRAIYGAGDAALLPRLIRAAEAGPLPLLRGGRAVTQLTHVDDVTEAIARALAAPPQADGRIYHITGPETLPLTDIIAEACSRAGVRLRWRAVPWPLASAAAGMAEALAHLRPGRPEPRITRYGLGLLAFSQVLDTAAAARDLGFVPRISFAEGLDETFGRGRPA